MYYLQQKQFKPAMILHSIVFVPCIVGLLIGNIVSFNMILFITLLVLSAIYAALISFLWKMSKNKGHYLLLKSEGIEITFLDIYEGQAKINLPYDQIKYFDYYRINSLAGWFCLYCGVLPKCVYITYDDINGEEQTKFIGYMDYKDIKKITDTNNIRLKVH